MKKYFALFPLFMMHLCFATNQATVVEAEQADYDSGTIYLQGNVFIENPMGEAQAQTAILKKEEEGDHKIDFPYVELKKAVVVKLTEGGTLACEEVSVDLIAMTSSFIGGSANKRVLYHDERGQILADEAICDFEQTEEGKYLPKKLTLSGNIQMQEPNQEQGRYALADYAEFFPKSGKLILEGREGNRVLFYDEKRQMQLSAKTIEAKRDPISGKESIRGYGNVKFIFAQEELKRLKHNFSFL